MMERSVDLRAPVTLAYQGMSLAAAAALLYATVVISNTLISGVIASATHVAPLHTIILAALIYIAGHIFRSMRLGLLIGGWNIGLRLITALHFMTAGVSLALPLKLGDIYRIAVLSRLLSSVTRAIEIVWWERLLDVIALIAITLIALQDIPPGHWQQFAGIIVLAFAFILISVLTFFVLPDNLRRTSIFIIRRYGSPRTIAILRTLNIVRRSIMEAPRMVRGKLGSVVALTLLIWACEIGTFAILLIAIGETITSAPESLLGLLSILTRGQTAVAVMHSGARLVMGPLLPYVIATQVPLVFLGLVAGLFYISQRLRRA